MSALITTQHEATQHVARTEVTAESEEVSVVPLTGDPTADEASILAEMTAIHDSFSGGVSAEEEDSLGYLAPGALQSLPLARPAPSASVLAADCRTGSVGQLRRRDTRWRSPGTQAVAYASIYYKRVSCARWKITLVDMTLIRPPDRDRVWFRNFYYNRAWLGDHYGDREAGKQCWRLQEDVWTEFRPGWTIQAGGSAQIEVIDANPNAPGTVPSCWMGAGTSFNSYKIFLPGGRS